VEVCSADSKKRRKKLLDVTESEQTQSTQSSDDESFLRDTVRLLEDFSHRARTQKRARVFRKPELASTLQRNSIFETRREHDFSHAIWNSKDKGLSPLSILVNELVVDD
jgi:hypothetical protein